MKIHCVESIAHVQCYSDCLRRGVCVMFAVMYGSRHFSSVFATTERSDMGPYEVPICVSLLGLGMGKSL